MSLDKKRIAYVDWNYGWRDLMESTLYDYIFRKFNSLDNAKNISTSELEKFDLIISERKFAVEDDGLIWLEDLRNAGHKVLLFSYNIYGQHDLPILCKNDSSRLVIRAMVEQLTS